MALACCLPQWNIILNCDSIWKKNYVQLVTALRAVIQIGNLSKRCIFDTLHLDILYKASQDLEQIFGTEASSAAH